MEGELTLTLGGTERKWQFSMWAMEELTIIRETIKPDNRQSFQLGTLVYAGLLNAWRKERGIKGSLSNEDRKLIPFTVDDCIEWVYDLFDSDKDVSVATSITNEFLNSNAYKSINGLNKKEDDDDEKKMLNGKMSTPSPSENLA